MKLLHQALPLLLLLSLDATGLRPQCWEQMIALGLTPQEIPQ
jgi:hypothetical protein